MPNLDIRTLSFIATFSSLLLGLGLQLVSWVIARNPSLRLWAIGALAIAAGFVLLALRGMAPDWLSIVAANTLLAIGSGWLYAGNREFQGRPRQFPWYWILVAGTAGGMFYFTYIVPDLSARIVVISAVIAAIRFPSAMVLLRDGGDSDRMVRWFVAAGYLLTALFLGFRALVMTFVGLTDQNFMAAVSPIQTFAVVLEIGLVVVLGIGLPLLVLGRTHRQLNASEDRYRVLIEWSPDPLAVHRGGKLVYVNPAALKMIGASTQEEVIGRPVLDWVHPDFRQIVIERAQAVTEQGLATSMIEEKFIRLDGSIIDVEVQNTAIAFDGETAVLVAMRDITERKRAAKVVEQYHSVVQASLDGFWITDNSGRILEVNDAVCRILGYTREELIGMSISDIEADESAEEISERTQEMIKTGYLKFEARHKRKDGAVIEVEVSVQHVPEFGDRLFVFIRDITKRKEAEEQIHTLAYFDALTNLPNRRLLTDRLGQALIASKRTLEFGALMILDLDNFKVLNDTQGHDVGDRLLVEVAKRIVVNMRQGDTVSRLGGDEFVMVIERLGANETAAARQAEVIAEKVRNALGHPYQLSHDKPQHHSTPSIGVTLFRGQDLSIEILLKQADMALYQAKGAGRNTIRFFSPEMQASVESRSAMEITLRKGLEHGEFKLFYQPQIDKNRNLTGAEALLRWFPANQSQVPPGQFIPLAEENGLIVPIGAWVINTACAQLKTWSADPSTRHLKIAINVSARQFRQPNFVEVVFDALRTTGADPTLLKLELTESVVVDDVEEIISRMQQIKALGVSFSLDDFGTGFSSLSYLKRLPLDQMKIDQSFVRDVTTDPNDAAIVRAIIAMGLSLGIHVIAEGVETEDQLDFLHQGGCENYQGYLFGRPVPIEGWPTAVH